MQSATVAPASAPTPTYTVPGSPAGPAAPGERLHPPPQVRLPRALQVLRFAQRQTEFVFRARREYGDVFGMYAGVPGGWVLTCHPEHVQSLFTARPGLVPSLTAESPLRPIVGPNSVLTANEPRHLRQRKLLLPPFHGEAIEQYRNAILAATERELERWPLGKPFALAPRMQALTLQVITSGVFGLQERPPHGTPEYRLLSTIRQLARISTSPLLKADELLNFGRSEPLGITRAGVAYLDRAVYPVLQARRRAADLEQRRDILSVLLGARTEDGERLTDRELRDELLTLLLAGFETTANSLAWTWERLLRTPHAHQALRQAVRAGGEQAEQRVEATIVEGMRSRPVIPIIGRRVTVPWRLGDHVVPAGSAIGMSILLLHHREDLYPEPFAFEPERWLHRKPGTYEWIPFGGGTRRCLGATLAMAEQRVVLRAMAERLELQADRPEPERTQHRNVTMIPARGARAILTRRA